MVSLAPSRTMLLPALLLVSLLPQDPALLQQDLEANVWMGTGFKIGEVTGTEAVVWTRVTGSRRAVGAPWPEGADAVPEGRTLAAMEGAVPGMRGRVQVSWRERGQRDWTWSSDWVQVDPDRDCTHQFLLTEGIRPGRAYDLTVAVRPLEDDPICERRYGSFRTPPAADVPAPARFTVTSCQSWRRTITCVASSRVGQTIKPIAFLSLINLLIIGIVKANVLPVPVCAVPKISRPVKLTGIDWL